jgi:hypothetical protein
MDIEFDTTLARTYGKHCNVTYLCNLGFSNWNINRANSLLYLKGKTILQTEAVSLQIDIIVI